VHSCKNATGRAYTVLTPDEEVKNGSRFGLCTCGVPKHDGIPSKHMVVLAKDRLIVDDIRKIIYHAILA
jgi:hypothetical protein